MHRGIEDIARERGVLIFSGSSDDDADLERDLALSFSAHGVDGLAVVPAGHDHRYLERERAAGVALVFVDRPRSGSWRTRCSATTGRGPRGGRALEAAGHRRIGFLGDRARLFTAGERLAGFGGDPALDAHGPRLVRGRAAGGARAARGRRRADRADLRSEPGDDRRAARPARARASGTTALVGFDDVALGDFLSPGLTVIAQDPFALGRHAAELLFARLEGDDSPPRRIVVPTRLIARGSGEIRPA